jgi:hypothetical protein
MTLDEFRQSLTATDAPAGLTLALAGLWWDAKGNWTRAHESAQQDGGFVGSRLSLGTTTVRLKLEQNQLISVFA